MKKICLISLLLFFTLFAAERALADVEPKSGSSVVNAGVTQPPTISPSPTSNPSATPTNIPTASLTPSVTPTATPTLAPGVSATNTPTPTLTSKDVYINISGLASPNASIVVTSKDVFLTSVVANSEGYFSMKQIKVDQQNGTMCFDTTDFKKVGTSYYCISIPNTKENFTKNNLFLPPTMGLSARRISVTGSAYAFGYSMPNSKVTTFISQGKTIESEANDSGYYKVQVKDLPVGNYYLFATAVFEEQNSEKTEKPLKLQSYSQGQLIIEESKSFLDKLFSSIAYFITHGGWIVLLIIILILILLSRRVREKIFHLIPGKKAQTYASKVPYKDKGLHHDWML